jgi:ATP-dependent Clp protease ATP-binding subunit ClpC
MSASPRPNVTPRLQQVLALARMEALKRNLYQVQPIHLLMGIVRLGQGVAFSVLEKHFRVKESVFYSAVYNDTAGFSRDRLEDVGFSWSSVATMVMAAQEKENAAPGGSNIGTEHLLLALAGGELETISGGVLRSLEVYYGEELKILIRRELEILAKT